MLRLFKAVKKTRPTGLRAFATATPAQMQSQFISVDGCEAATYIAYALSEHAFLFPITPSTTMGELMDAWGVAGRKNIWGNKVNVDVLHSEAGAAGALHGSIAAGTLTTTFTASQGLLLKIPNMFLIAGELMPTVFHVAARSLTKHALSIHGDHMDVMHARTTGFALLCSASVQESMDMATIAHIATLKARLPFLHFFDGFRTSAEISKIEPVSYDSLRKIYPKEALQKNLRAYSLNPHSPLMRGTGQRPDVFFQAAMAGNRFQLDCPAVVADVMEQFGAETGRLYHPFDYWGAPDAEDVIISMGSSVQTINETITYLNARGENLGHMAVRLYRPWSEKYFLECLPKTAKRITVLDRTKEDGSPGQPLYLDVVHSLEVAAQARAAEGRAEPAPVVSGGIYGIASKEFSPAMVKAAFDNMRSGKAYIQQFTLGINDDVTHTSIPIGEPLQTTPASTTQCIFWGLGSDGTVGANRAATKTIADHTDLKVQGYFSYDAYKTDGTTCSHLRFGPETIQSEYMITDRADYVACHKDKYVKKFDMLAPLKDGGIFVLNSKWDLEQLEEELPRDFKRQLAEKNVQFYNIDAQSIAEATGLGGRRINSVMQAVFYSLSGVLPADEAVAFLKADIERLYHHKGPRIVDQNIHAVDETAKHLKQVDYPADKWRGAAPDAANPGSALKPEDAEHHERFYKDVFDPVMQWAGDEIPVSAITPGGYLPATGSTVYERRGIAGHIPVWEPDKCTQCNYCAVVCPHAACRTFLVDRVETKEAPESLTTRRAKGGSEMSGLNFSVLIAPYDCTGCEVCVRACPDDALHMALADPIRDSSSPAWDYACGLKNKANPLDRFSVKGSQFEQPLLEFSGACAGCGETPYVKLLTQLFGERMVLCNATGCSMIWGSMFPSNPYTVRNDNGRGPAYGHSLFEDGAEYGFGVARGGKTRRDALVSDVDAVLGGDVGSADLKKLLQAWTKNSEDPFVCEELFPKICGLLESEDLSGSEALSRVKENKDLLTVPSYWLIGGDGWAYDIGSGGLDHVLAEADANVNVLVLDNEFYANTGGQLSKATPKAASAKFASAGNRGSKKDLGLQVMSYGHVYVAQVAQGANYAQTVQAFKEAESYPGPSLILSLTPCIDWGWKSSGETMELQRLAVDTGYWPLYRYDPRRKDKKFQLDSKRIKADLSEYLDPQTRFTKLKREDPETAARLQGELRDSVREKMELLNRMARDDLETLDFLKKAVGEAPSGEKAVILYGSETGNAQAVATQLGYELTRRGQRATCVAMDDFDFEELPETKNAYCVVSTVGQGEFPGNCQEFWKRLSDPTLPSDFLKEVNFSVFGLGDSSYVFFNQAAVEVDRVFTELGATKIKDIALGDDKDDEKYETAYHEWAPSLMQELGLPPPPDQLMPPSYQVNVIAADAGSEAPYLPGGCKLVPCSGNGLLTPADYERDIRHYVFDIDGRGLDYETGDVLAIYPKNDPTMVDEFLDRVGIPSTEYYEVESSGAKPKVPGGITKGRLFTEVLDIFGRPSRNFYDFLGQSAQDEKEKADLKHLLTKDGAGDLKALVDETVTHADLLEMFPSSIPSLDYMAEYIPNIKPRLYSIASAPEMKGTDLELCIVLDDWTAPSGKYRTGLNSSYLTGLREGEDHITGKIQAGACPMPPPDTPVVMVGLGTGMAPLRAFAQGREVAKASGVDTAPFTIIYGARYSKNEFLYEDELKSYVASGSLTNLLTAFSRDQGHKIYVQDRIRENQQLVYDTLVTGNGAFYLCGQAGRVPEAARLAIADALQAKGGMTQQQADDYITQMRIEGRYHLDVW